MQFTVDLSGIHPAAAQRVVRSLRHADAARHALGLVEQAKLKRLHDACSVPGGLGRGELRPRMILSDDQWQRFMQKYGQRCWSDPDFAPWVLKQDQHADLRVNDKGTRIQVGYTGEGATRRA